MDATTPDFQRALARQVGTPETMAYLRDISNIQTAMDGCSKEFLEKMDSLQPHQQVVFTMAQMRAADTIQTPGLLALHSTGAGKTLIGLSCLVAFWDRKNPKGAPVPIFMVSTSSNQSHNSLWVLAKLALRFFSDFPPFDIRDTPEYRKVAQKGAGDAFALKLAVADDQACQDIIRKRIRERLRLGLEGIVKEKYYEKMIERDRSDLYTFIKLGTDLDQDVFKLNKSSKMEHAVFVIDEVQFLNAPPSTEKSQMLLYAKVRALLQQGRNPKNTWCLALTATPGETIEQFIDIMNCVGGSRNMLEYRDLASCAKDPADEERCIAKMRGLISYAYLQDDLSHFPRLADVRAQCIALDKESVFFKVFAQRTKRLLQLRQECLDKRAKEGAKRHKCTQWVYDPEKKTDYQRLLREASNFIVVRAARPGGVSGDGDSDGDGDGEEGEGAAEAPPRGARVYGERVLRQRDALKRPDKFRPGAASVGRHKDDDPEDEDDVLDDEVEALDDTVLRECTRETCFVIPVEDGTGKASILVSPKLMRMVDVIKKNPKAKHFVYTGSPLTMLVIAYLLETLCGLRQLKPRCSAAKETNPCVIPKDGDGDGGEEGAAGRQRHFILLDNVQSKKDALKHYQYNSKFQKLSIGLVKDETNKDANYLGENVSVVLGTRESFKGIDMNHLQHLHLVDAMADYQDFIQFCGRGPRFCSHRMIQPISQRRVNVHLYRLLMDEKQCPAMDEGTAKALRHTDCMLWNESRQRYDDNWLGLWEKIEEAAVDRQLFQDTLHRDIREGRKKLYDVECKRVVQAQVGPVGPDGAVAPQRQQKPCEAIETEKGCAARKKCLWKAELQKCAPRKEKNNNGVCGKLKTSDECAQKAICQWSDEDGCKRGPTAAEKKAARAAVREQRKAEKAARPKPPKPPKPNAGVCGKLKTADECAQKAICQWTDADGCKRGPTAAEKKAEKKAAREQLKAEKADAPKPPKPSTGVCGKLKTADECAQKAICQWSDADGCKRGPTAAEKKAARKAGAAAPV